MAAAAILGDDWASERLRDLDHGIRKHCPLLGQPCEIVGPSQRNRNGKIAHVLNWDLESGAYVVQLVEGGVAEQGPIHLAPKHVRACGPELVVRHGHVGSQR